MKRCALILAFMGLALACSKSRTEVAPTAASSSAMQAQAPALTSAEPTTRVADDVVPTEEDFEEEAEHKITAQNLEAELDQLEKEISD